MRSAPANSDPDALPQSNCWIIEAPPHPDDHWARDPVRSAPTDQTLGLRALFSVDAGRGRGDQIAAEPRRSWRHYPVGSTFNPDTMRMENQDVSAVIFNPAAKAKCVHAVSASYGTGAIFVMAIGAYSVLRGRDQEFAERSMAVAASSSRASAPEGCAPTSPVLQARAMTNLGSKAVASALRTVSVEREGLCALEEALGGPLAAAFDGAVKAILASTGRVIVTGMGKSGHIARKIAATLASTGQPASFVHPAEASHGDLGMVQNGDVVLALSWSGESSELAAIVTYAKRFAIPLIAMTSRAESALGREADVLVLLPVAAEACPNGLAPTTSTTMQLVLGDALAIALIEAKGFSARDFGLLHPGGKLGAKLAYIRDIMHTGDRVPRIRLGARMADAILEMSAKGFGCVGVFDKRALVGIITDGDLRRHLESTPIVDTRVEEVMTRSPRTIAPDALVAQALALISRKISALLVVENGEVVGIVHFHDLMRVGAV